MTSSITRLPATTNNTTSDAPASSGHGITRACEQVVYHVASLAQSVLYEAEQLTSNLARTASARCLDHDGTKGSTPLDMAEVAAVLGEALDCIDVASEQLSRLSVDIRMRREPETGF